MSEKIGVCKINIALRKSEMGYSFLTFSLTDWVRDFVLFLFYSFT